MTTGNRWVRFSKKIPFKTKPSCKATLGNHIKFLNVAIILPFYGKEVMRHDEHKNSERRLMCHGYCDFHENGGNVMANKLDAEQIERARHKSEKSSRKKEERRLIQETIAKNRNG